MSKYFGGSMNQENTEIKYEEFFSKPHKERLQIFNEISPVNRAKLVKMQTERWLKSNRSRLNNEQISVLEEIIQSISLDWYQERTENSKVNEQASYLAKKAEKVLSREDLIELSYRAKYIPAKG